MKIMLFDFPRKPTQSEIKIGKTKFQEKQGYKATKHVIRKEGEKFFLTIC